MRSWPARVARCGRTPRRVRTSGGAAAPHEDARAHAAHQHVRVGHCGTVLLHGLPEERQRAARPGSVASGLCASLCPPPCSTSQPGDRRAVCRESRSCRAQRACRGCACGRCAQPHRPVLMASCAHGPPAAAPTRQPSSTPARWREAALCGCSSVSSRSETSSSGRSRRGGAPSGLVGQAAAGGGGAASLRPGHDAWHTPQGCDALRKGRPAG